jgi:uncharacterized membrane protein
MKSLIDFFKMTIAGGFFVVLPVVLVWMLLVETVDLLAGLAKPILLLVLPQNVDPARVPVLASILALVGVSFLIGVLMRTGLGQRIGGFLERWLLEPLPGYTVLRSLSRRLSGADESSFVPAVLESADGTRTPVLAVEQHADGSVTVLVPIAPTPTVGTVQVIPGDRVTRLDASLNDFMIASTHWGAGTEEMLGKTAPPQG